jgi:hypothetical protein
MRSLFELYGTNHFMRYFGPPKVHGEIHAHKHAQYVSTHKVTVVAFRLVVENAYNNKLIEAKLKTVVTRYPEKMFF